jgi:hypothetical protein
MRWLLLVLNKDAGSSDPAPALHALFRTLGSPTRTCILRGIFCACFTLKVVPIKSFRPAIDGFPEFIPKKVMDKTLRSKFCQVDDEKAI